MFGLFTFYIKLKGPFDNMFKLKDESGQPMATISYNLDVTPISSLSLQEQPDLFI